MNTNVNLTGTWQARVELKSKGGEVVATPVLKLHQDGEELTGTYVGKLGTFMIKGKLVKDEVELDLEVTESITAANLDVRNMHISALLDGECQKMYGNLASKYSLCSFRGTRQ